MSKLLNNTGYTKEQIKVIKKETYDKWDKLGFLEGLVGHIDPNIAKLYECCASSLLSGDTKN
jgi:hypothetical protein